MTRIIFIFLLILINKSFSSEYSLINDFKIKYTENYVKNIPAKNNDGSYNVIIEIPSGTNQKWEISEDKNSLELEFKNGFPRVINYLGYPANYGFIPNTKVLKSERGDGDEIDILVINDIPIERGDRVKVRVIGMLKLIDKGKIDNKIISVKEDSIFAKIKSLENLENDHSGVLEIFSIWFENYKGVNLEFLGFEEKKKAKEFIKKFEISNE